MALPLACDAPRTLDQVEIPASFRFETLRSSVVRKEPPLAAVLAAHPIRQIGVFTAEGTPLFTGSPLLLDTKLEVALPVGTSRVLIDLVGEDRVFTFEAELDAAGLLHVIGEVRS